MSLVDSVVKELLPKILPYAVSLLAGYIPDLRVYLLELASQSETKIDDVIANSICDVLQDIADSLKEDA